MGCPKDGNITLYTCPCIYLTVWRIAICPNIAELGCLHAYQRRLQKNLVQMFSMPRRSHITVAGRSIPFLVKHTLPRRNFPTTSEGCVSSPEIRIVQVLSRQFVFAHSVCNPRLKTLRIGGAPNWWASFWEPAFPNQSALCLPVSACRSHRIIVKYSP